ncbi:acyl carrier protein [Rhizobium sp. BK181]|uniref:acyl carrier protein n=1 Tax=Rhizobium sp. BK181 TaxID=2587072 RepID=UPI00160EB33D|nr:acyl carrier protein [Rhizobium sp. BK181]MBB3315498.1 acyl carrier protein [Rhizobium sp. BK181]
MNDRLVTLLADVFGLRREEIVPHLTKDDVGSWDSLKQMDLVVSLEREFNVELEIADIITMTSVEKINRVLKAKGVTIEA